MCCQQTPTKRLEVTFSNSIPVPFLLHGSNLEKEMLASYKDIMSKPCARCGKVLSETAQFPSARRLLDGVDVDSGAGQDWLALHEECVQAKS